MKSKIEAYQKQFKKHGVSHRALKWKNKDTAKLRHQLLVEHIEGNKNKTVLDFGCGFGDLINTLEEGDVEFEYTGVDMVPEFITEAKKLHPKHKFLNIDYLEKPLDKKFDVVICSGALNSNFPDSINFRKKAIRLLFNNANEIFAFNMAGAYPQPKNKESNAVYYVDSIEIYKYCLTLTKKAILDNSYLPSDFTITLLK